MGFLNPLEELHLLASPNLTLYNEVYVYFHDTVESADPDVGGRVTRFVTTDYIAIISLKLKNRAVSYQMTF